MLDAMMAIQIRSSTSAEPNQMHYLLAISIVLMLLPELALAHVESGVPGSGGFLSGLAHPITGFDHVVAIVSLACGVRFYLISLIRIER